MNKESSNILVSVVIPCYNVENYVIECIHSVYKQDYKNIEVIAVNNNSSDDTLNQLKDLKQNYYSDLIIVEEKKKGANAARNTGAYLAKGEWIQFLDADDLLIESKLSHQIAIIESEIDIDLICASYIYLYANGDKSIKAIDDKNVLLGLYNKSAGITSANLFKKKSLKEVNFWNEEIYSSQEFDLMFCMFINNAKFCFDNKPNTILREREGQISSINPSVSLANFCELRISYLDILKNKKNETYEKNYTALMISVLSAVVTLSCYDKVKSKQLVKELDVEYQLVKKERTLSSVTVLLFKTLPLYLFFKILCLKNKC